MNSLQNVHLSWFNRVIPSSKTADPKIARGVATHKFLGKYFADKFGSGTVAVEINNKKVYLNKGSCFKLLYGSDKLAPKKTDFLNRSDDEIISALQDKFDGKSAHSVHSIGKVVLGKFTEVSNPLLKEHLAKLPYDPGQEQKFGVEKTSSSKQREGIDTIYNNAAVLIVDFTLYRDGEKIYIKGATEDELLDKNLNWNNISMYKSQQAD